MLLRVSARAASMLPSLAALSMLKVRVTAEELAGGCCMRPHFSTTMAIQPWLMRQIAPDVAVITRTASPRLRSSALFLPLSKLASMLLSQA